MSVIQIKTVRFVVYDDQQTPTGTVTPAPEIQIIGLARGPVGPAGPPGQNCTTDVEMTDLTLLFNNALI